MPEIIGVHKDSGRFDAMALIEIADRFLNALHHYRMFVVAVAGFDQFLQAAYGIFADGYQQLLQIFARKTLFQQHFQVVIGIAQRE
ncbi:hypothetical protein SDC9_57910 [bioreactor metagenome]|uniref:Uncharacterized protein n=1 Tax=bioreactor metagenome TaxID=1076179 RepID=A0A644XBM4_9ZZZZ